MIKLIFILLLTNLSYSKVVVVDSAGTGDFATIQEGLDDFDLDQSSVAGHDTLKIKKGTYVENLVMPEFTGLNAANNFFIMAFPGDEHNGDSSTGVEIQSSAAFIWTPAVERTKVHNIIFKITEATDVYAMDLTRGYYAHCMFFITSARTASNDVIKANFTTITNSLIDVNLTAALSTQRCIVGQEWGNGYGYLVNSVVRGCVENIRAYETFNTISIIKPNVASTKCWKDPGAASNYNVCIKDGHSVTADTTAPGANSLVKTLAQVGFVDYEGLDWHITSRSHAFNVGTPPVAGHPSTAFRSTDMDGETWTLSSMGFDQPENLPVSITNPNSGNNKISGDSGRIVLTGNYSGTPDSLQMRYGVATGWITIDDSPSGNSFSVTVNLPNTFGNRYVSVRQMPSGEVDSVQLYMGHIRVWAGQSNSIGSGTTDMPFTGAHENFLMKHTGWGPLENPIEPGASTHSILPYMASLMAANYPDSVPQIWVFYAKSLACTFGPDAAKLWCPDTSAASFDSLNYVINNSNIDYIKDFLFFQGESDASNMPAWANARTIYQTRKSNMLDSLRTRRGQPEIVGFLGYIGYRVADSINAVRVAQQNIGALGNWKPTTPTYDVDYSTGSGGDGAHFKDSTEQRYQAQRVYRGWASHYVFSGGHGRGPVLDSALWIDATTIRLVFDLGAGLALSPASPRKELFLVNEGGAKTIASAAADGNIVTLTMTDSVTLAATVSIGHTNDGVCLDSYVWADCLRDDGTYPAPPEVVINQTLSLPAVASSKKLSRRNRLIRFGF